MAKVVNPAAPGPQPSTSAAPPKPADAAQPVQASPGQVLSGGADKLRVSLSRWYKHMMERAKRDPEFSSPLMSFRYMLVGTITVVAGISVGAVWLLRYATDSDKWMRNETLVLGSETMQSDSLVVPRLGLREPELSGIVDREKSDRLQTRDYPAETQQTTISEEGASADEEAEEKVSNQTTVETTTPRTRRSEGSHPTSRSKWRTLSRGPVKTI